MGAMQRPPKRPPGRARPQGPAQQGSARQAPRRPRFEDTAEAPRGHRAGPGRFQETEAPPPQRGRRAPGPAPMEADSSAAPRPGAGAGSGAFWLYGEHTVAAAIRNPRRKNRRLLVTEDAEKSLRAALNRPWRLPPERIERQRFGTFLTEDAVHQGVALLVEPLEPVALEDAIAASDGPVLLLDQVTDPRNVGAILRSAAAFGAACVVLQDRHAPPETGALARAASGALDIVPVVREVNLSRAIASLQKSGVWVMGLAGDASRTLAEARPRDRRVALVLGAEDTGLRRLQRETCDELVRLPITPAMESLNVAAAAAVALYEVIREDGA